MTREEFRSRLDNLGLTIAAFGRLAGRNIAQVSMWGSETRAPFPQWVDLLLKCWEKHPGLLTECLAEQTVDTH